MEKEKKSHRICTVSVHMHATLLQKSFIYEAINKQIIRMASLLIAVRFQLWIEFSFFFFFCILLLCMKPYLTLSAKRHDANNEYRSLQRTNNLRNQILL